MRTGEKDGSRESGLGIRRKAAGLKLCSLCETRVSNPEPGETKPIEATGLKTIIVK